MGLGTFFKSMLGGNSQSPDAAINAVAATEEYKGFTIEATPIEEAGQFRTAGRISREIEGVVKTARFIRADNSTDREHSANHALAKGRQLIDEQGERLLEREHV